MIEFITGLFLMGRGGVPLRILVMSGVAFVLGLAAASLAAAVPAATGDGPPEHPWGPPSDGLRSQVWAERVRFRVGDPIVIRYRIRNEAKTPRTVWHSGFWPNHRVDVTTADGQDVAPTPDGRRVRDAFSPNGPREKNVPVALASGQIDDIWPELDLTGLFELSRPGRYRVAIRYQEGEMAPVVSNSLEFVVGD